MRFERRGPGVGAGAGAEDGGSGARVEDTCSRAGVEDTGSGAETEDTGSGPGGGGLGAGDEGLGGLFRACRCRHRCHSAHSDGSSTLRLRRTAGFSIYLLCHPFGRLLDGVSSSNCHFCACEAPRIDPSMLLLVLSSCEAETEVVEYTVTCRPRNDCKAMGHGRG